MALELSLKCLQTNLSFEAFFCIHFFKPTIFVFKLFHSLHQRSIHATELSPPFIKCCGAYAMLSTELWNGHTIFILFDDRQYLAISEFSFTHRKLLEFILIEFSINNCCDFSGGLQIYSIPCTLKIKNYKQDEKVY